MTEETNGESRVNPDGASAITVGAPAVPPPPQPESTERVGLTLQAAMDSVRQTGSSSEAVAMETAHRLIQTMSAWLETLEQRRATLRAELSAREAELTTITDQIQRERAGASVLATAAQRWADEIQLGVSQKRSALEDESRELGRQAQAISQSIQQLLEGLSGAAKLAHPAETPEADTMVKQDQLAPEPRSERGPSAMGVDS